MSHIGGLELPWFLPGAAISVVVSTALTGSVGRALRVRRWVAWVVVMSLGVILAATLTPLHEALASGAQGSSTCDMSRLGLAPIRELIGINDTSLNVLLFIPFGAAVGAIQRSATKLALVAGAIALPFLIESLQLVTPILDRGCEAADVVDNLTGLVIGLTAGALAGRVRPGTFSDQSDRNHVRSG